MSAPLEDSSLRIPRATYRLQLNRDFTFADAARTVPYFAHLGISHLYVSPILKARPGSLHGYDVTDHTRLNPELGTRADFEHLIAALHEHDMGLIVDIVPNHLGIMGCDNEWWLDVLENGPAARYARYFDIDWRPDRLSMRDRVLVPVLGDAYGAVLERGELCLSFDLERASFMVRYHEHCMPIDPREYPRIFSTPVPQQLLAPDDPSRADFESLISAFGNLPARNELAEEAVTIRYRDKEAHKRRLMRLIERSAPVREHIERTLTALNGTPGVPASFDALDALLEAQAWRLSYWRVALEEINYRRFFDVNDLAALRMDDAEVFDSTHACIFELIEQGGIDGLRIDHSDGLYDPEAYFARLRERTGELYVVTEKILAAHERLPERWAVHGTTGYDFVGLCTAWLVYGDSETRMTSRYRQFTGSEASFDEIAYRSRQLVMRASLAAEVEVLASQLDRIAQLDRHTADFTRAAMREAIREVIACFPVYRTYVSARAVGEESRRTVHWAVNVARRHSTGVELSVFDFLEGVLLGDAAEDRPALREAMLEFAMKFQQVTAPVMAKGVEDTAFYRYNRLVCLNEVGADPRRYGLSSHALHQANLERWRSWPHAMLATATHDTKRGEDVRARIAVLSELPELWQRHLGRWARLNRGKRSQQDAGPAPDRQDEYLLYQTLLGVWSPSQDELQLGQLRERLQAYIVKAAREAKRRTSWLNPDAGYEAALELFVAQLLANPARNAFLRDFAPFAATVAYFGRINALVQTALKITSPGVPDFYQGTELPALTLVDPDNRRPVDFQALQRRLQSLDGLARLPPALLADPEGTAPKLHLTATLLKLRRLDPELFRLGNYQPLQIEGVHKEHAFAFARSHEDRCLIVLVPRWNARLMQGQEALPLGERVWQDTALLADAAVPQGPWMDVLSGRICENVSSGRGLCSQSDAGTGEHTGYRAARVGELLRDFPIAALYCGDRWVPEGFPGADALDWRKST